MNVRTHQFVRVMVFISMMIFGIVGLTSANEQVTLFHYKFNARVEQLQLLEQLAAEFEAQNPHITIEILTGPESPEYEEKVKIMLAGGKPPDVTEFYPLIASNLAEANQFLDLRPFIERDTRWADMRLTPSAVEGSTWADGTIYMVPSLIGANILAYNRDLTQMAGFADPADLGDQWTWDEMMTMVRGVTEDRDGDGVPDIYGNMGRVSLPRVLTFMLQAGGIPFDSHMAPKTANFRSSPVQTGAAFVAQLLDPELGTSNYNHFINGRAGFTWIGIFPFSVELARIREESNEHDFRVAPWPTGPAGNNFAISEVRGWQIMKGSKHPEEAWQWLSFVHLSEERALRYANVHGWIPASENLQMPWLDSLGFSGVERDMVFTALETSIGEGNLPTPIGHGVLDITSAWDQYFRDVTEKRVPLENFLEDMNLRAEFMLAR